MLLRPALVTAGVSVLVVCLAGAADAAPAPRPKPRLDGTSSPHLRIARQALERHDSVVLVAAVGSGQPLDSVAERADRGPGDVAHVLGALRRVSVRVPDRQAADAAARLRAIPGVTSVTRASYRHFAEVPNDTGYAEQASYLNSVAAPAAWSRTHGSSAVKIAVVDSGVDTGHPDLDAKIVGRYNAHNDVDADNNGQPDGDTTDVTDTIGHGTFVAGVAAAETDNAQGVAGAGYAASVLAVKVDYRDGDESVITTDDEARGIVWAVNNGADIVNLSLGSTESDPTEQAAITYAEDHDVLVVAAAGNENTMAKSYPAAYDGVVAVGATDAAGHRAEFSNHGSWVTLAAPGVNIHSTTPRAGSEFFPTTSGYDTADGTSFSAPLVAGAAALLLGAHPDATAVTLRSALVHGAHGYAGLGLGAGQVDFDRGLDQFAPSSTPATPTVTGSSGDVDLSTASDAAAVRFSVDGIRLPVVATTGGTARTSFSSYGWADGPHTLSAVDCSASSVCATTSSSTSFELANAKPILTSPPDGAQLTGGFTFSADSSGGGVAFLVDGRRVAFDGAAPHSQPYSGSALSEGEHTITAVQCSVSGARCDGPSSDPTTVTSQSLHPTIVSVAPSPFSPNGDRVKDTTTLTYALPDRETARVSVLNAVGTVVRSSTLLGTFAGGPHTWVWNGRGSGNGGLPSGTYTIVLDTSATVNGAAVRGQVRRGVLLDVTPPALTGSTGNRSTFYPVRDGYRDLFSPTVALGERSTLSLEIRNSRNGLVRSVSAVRNAGRTSLSWNGTDSRNRPVAAGTYRWRFVALDTAGNRRTSGSYTVVRSAKRLVAARSTLTHTADNGEYYGPPCTDIYRSAFERGIDIVNECDYDTYGSQIIEGEFGFTLPAAIFYDRVTLGVRGRTSFVPTEVAGFYSRTDGGDPDLGVLDIRSEATRSYGFRSVRAAGHVTSRRAVNVAFAVTNAYTGTGGPSEFDLASVSLTITYRVLR